MTDPENYNTLVWTETRWPKPTKEWLERKIQKRIAGLNNSARINRREAYPDIIDQLDMLWHGMNADASKRIEPFYSSIKAIKDQYPKI